MPCGGVGPTGDRPPDPLLERLAPRPASPVLLHDLALYLEQRGEIAPACLEALTGLSGGDPSMADSLVRGAACGGCAAAALWVAPWDGGDVAAQRAREEAARTEAFRACDAVGPDPLLAGAFAAVRPGVAMPVYAVLRATVDPLVASGRASPALRRRLAETLLVYSTSLGPEGAWGPPGIAPLAADLARCPVAGPRATLAFGQDGRSIPGATGAWCVDRALEATVLEGPALVRLKPLAWDSGAEVVTEGLELKVTATGAVEGSWTGTGDLVRRRGTQEPPSFVGSTREVGAVVVSAEGRPTLVTVGGRSFDERWFRGQTDELPVPGKALHVVGEWRATPKIGPWDGSGFSWDAFGDEVPVGKGVVELRWAPASESEPR